MTFKDWDSIRKSIARRDVSREMTIAKDLIGRPMITGWVIQSTRTRDGQEYEVIFAQGFRAEDDAHWAKMREFYGDRFQGERYFFPDADSNYNTDRIFSTKAEAVDRVIEMIERDIKNLEERLAGMREAQVEYLSWANGGIQV